MIYNKIINALQRPPASSNSIIREVEGLRFIAIIGVLFMHMGTQILRTNSNLNVQGDFIYLITKNGGFGVNLFFSISGFILAYPFAQHYLLGKPKMPLKAFYFKRLTRLEPPFIINIILLFAFQVIIMHMSFRDGFPHFIATATYTHSFIYNTWSTINPVTWSLEAEIQFYLLAPFLCRGLYIIKKPFARIIILISVILFVNVLHSEGYQLLKSLHLSKSLLYFMDNFLIGILFLELFMWKGFITHINQNYIWDLVCFSAIITMFVVVSNLHAFVGGVLLNICIFFIFLGAFKGVLANKFFKFNFIVIIGGMCYTIYLYHYAIFFFISKYTAGLFKWSNKFGVQWLLQGAIMLSLALFICSFLFYWLEKPFMRKQLSVRRPDTRTK